MARLPVLCAQEYDGLSMRVTACGRCQVGWDHSLGRCSVDMGVEHLPLTDEPGPPCPIESRCQHALQAEGLCPVRARGLVCVSALVEAGWSEAEAHDHPDSFHAGLCA